MAPEIFRIEDPSDRRIAAYRDIRERDLVGREGLFIAEGKVVLNVLFAARRFEPQSVLVLENRLAGLSETLAAAPDAMPVYVASREVMDRIAGFPVHRGVLALGRKRPPESPASLLETLPRSALVLLLVGISNHDNMGAIFRNAAAFDADAILLDESCCDPLYRKAIRVSVGAVLKVPFAAGGSATELLSALGNARFRTIALSPQGELDIATLEAPQRTALILGAEGPGLPGHILSATLTARIAMSESFDSLNVATAAAIALHRLWRQRQASAGEAG
jgi:tRNA G18 (ribose-2'-O)-methylase SpoU